VLEATGVKDVLSKSLGSSNPVNVVRATVLALASLEHPEAAVARRKAELEVKEVGSSD
jgi:small subunit ribosomal protein S5